MSTMVAFHGKSAIKQKYLRRVRAHRKADAIVKGRYWEDGKGCAVGCTIHSSNHSAYETELGIPVQLAYLEDEIFENLPNAKAMEWPERFLKAARPGAELSHVVNRFLIWLLIDDVYGVVRFAETEAERLAIRTVAALHQRVIEGNRPAAAGWGAARDLRYLRDRLRERRLAGSATWGPAWAAIGVAEDAARDFEDATLADAHAAARAAARSVGLGADEAAYTSYADKIIQLMEAE